MVDGTRVAHLEFEKTPVSGISWKLLNIFPLLFLVPTEVFWRHFLEHSELEKSENFPLKNRVTFVSYFEKWSEKIYFLEISRKLLNIFSWLFLVPTEEFWRHILEYSGLEKSENFQFKNCVTFIFFLKKKTTKDFLYKLARRKIKGISFVKLKGISFILNTSPGRVVAWKCER